MSVLQKSEPQFYDLETLREEMKKQIMFNGDYYELPMVHIIREGGLEKKIILAKKSPSGIIPYNHVWFVVGIRGAGKSSFLEYLAEHYLRVGSCIVDIFGSRDGENLAWLRSPWAHFFKILILHSPKIELEIGLEDINVETMPYTEFQENMTEKYDIIISSPPLYGEMDEEYDAINHIMNELRQRAQAKRHIYIVIREAGRLIYSRLKETKNQVEAKAQAINLIRELRHMKSALGIDTHKWTTIDIDARIHSDYVVIKNIGQYQLPKELSWIFSYIDPPILRKLEPHEFIVVSKTSLIGIGVFSFPPWHKETHEDIFEALKIKIIK